MLPLCVIQDTVQGLCRLAVTLGENHTKILVESTGEDQQCAQEFTSLILVSLSLSLPQAGIFVSVHMNLHRVVKRGKQFQYHLHETKWGSHGLEKGWLQNCHSKPERKVFTPLPISLKDASSVTWYFNVLPPIMILLWDVNKCAFHAIQWYSLSR